MGKRLLIAGSILASLLPLITADALTITGVTAPNVKRPPTGELHPFTISVRGLYGLRENREFRLLVNYKDEDGRKDRSRKPIPDIDISRDVFTLDGGRAGEAWGPESLDFNVGCTTGQRVFGDAHPQPPHGLTEEFETPTYFEFENAPLLPIDPNQPGDEDLTDLEAQFLNVNITKAIWGFREAKCEVDARGDLNGEREGLKSFSSEKFGFNFITDPEELGFAFSGTAEWRQDGGNPNGYVSITDALNGQRGAMIFPEFQEGDDVNAFSMTADLRVGGGTAQPADGFSFNLARPDDPVFQDPVGEGYASSPTGEANLPEEGTTTGLAIGFDEWFSGGDDVIGMSIRVDNELIHQFEFPTLNGNVDDQTSLQTGAQGVDAAELGWARLAIELNTDNNLLITYKDVDVFNETVDYEPGPGQFVIAGRTGGANSAHHIDNITIKTNAAVSGLGGSELQAGDADQDLDVDQLDLVQVQIAAKYLTGRVATWGEGDWNGAPGGSPGNPPIGNGLFNQFDVIAAQQAGVYLTGPYRAVRSGGQENDGQSSIVYDAGSGELSLDAPVGVELTSINIDSAAGLFTGVSAQNLGGSFDNDADNNIFKATFGGSFGSLSFGNVAQPGLSEEFVLSDLSVVGSLAGGGDLGSVDLVYVPEPASALLLAIGLVIGLTRIRHAKTPKGTSATPRRVLEA